MKEGNPSKMSIKKIKINPTNPIKDQKKTKCFDTERSQAEERLGNQMPAPKACDMCTQTESI